MGGTSLTVLPEARASAHSVLLLLETHDVLAIALVPRTLLLKRDLMFDAREPQDSSALRMMSLFNARSERFNQRPSRKRFPHLAVCNL